MTQPCLAALLVAAGLSVSEQDLARLQGLALSLLADGERLTGRVDPAAPVPATPPDHPQ